MIGAMEANALPDFLREEGFDESKDDVKQIGLVHWIQKTT